jgi:hypothetical protein
MSQYYDDAESITDDEIEALFNAPTREENKPLNISEEQSLRLAHCQSREEVQSLLQEWGYGHIFSR